MVEKDNEINKLREKWYKGSSVKYLPVIIEDLSRKFEDIFSVINGYCQMGLRDGNMEIHRESLEHILEVSQKGSILIQQLMAVSKISEGYLMFSFKEGFNDCRKKELHK